MVAEDKKVMVCHKRCEISHRAVFFLNFGREIYKYVSHFLLFFIFFFGGEGGFRCWSRERGVAGRPADSGAGRNRERRSEQVAG